MRFKALKTSYGNNNNSQKAFSEFKLLRRSKDYVLFYSIEMHRINEVVGTIVKAKSCV